MAEPEGWTILFKGYRPVDDPMPVRLQRLLGELDHLPESAMQVDEATMTVTIDCSQLPGWEDAARQSIHTVRAGRRIVVRPPWEAYAPCGDELVLEIDPGDAFGSGLHETTALCLEALEQHVRPGSTVVDFGAGTGILSIAAARLGAARVAAIELDSDSVRIARENVLRNGVEGTVVVCQSESPACVGGPADVVVANMVTPILRAHRWALAGALRQDGVLITSGTSTGEAEEVGAALESAGLRVAERLGRPGWVALVAAKVRKDGTRDG